MLNRRDLLTLGTATATASILTCGKSHAARDDAAPHPIEVVDTNVNLFHWPFRRLPLDETAALVGKLRSQRITQAWAGSFESLLHRDLTSVNLRLVHECRKHKELIPIGSVNPALPGWEDDLKWCREEQSMPGIRLHPNYHGYPLDDPRLHGLLKLAAKQNLIVQMAVAMEDPRTQSEQLRVPDVDLSPLPAVVEQIPGLRIQLLNWYRPRPPLLTTLAETGRVYFDISRADGTEGVPNLVKSVPAGRVLFGSHTPFLISEASLIRVHESGQLNEQSMRAVLSGNARKLLAGAHS